MKTEKEITEMLAYLEGFDPDIPWDMHETHQAIGRNAGKRLALEWILGKEVYLKQICDEYKKDSELE